MSRNNRWAQGSVLALLLAFSLAGPFYLIGCLDDGDDGAPGAAGTNGAPAPIPPTDPNLGEAENLPGVVIGSLAVSGGSGTNGNFQVGDSITVTFTLKKNDGTAIGATELTSSGIYVSGPTTNYQRVIASTSSWHTAATQNTDGSWTYTIPTAIPANYLAPYGDTADIGADHGDLGGTPLLSGTYTVGIQAYKTYTGATGLTYRDVANATVDFLFGTATTIEVREVVKTANCNQCHVTLQFHGGSRRDVKLCVLCHTSGAEDKNATTDLDGDGDVDDDDATRYTLIDFKVMIHKIHNGAHLPSVLGVTTDATGARDYTVAPKPYWVVAGSSYTIHDYSEIGFPVWPSLNVDMPRDYGYSALTAAAKSAEGEILNGITACAKCHGDPDGSGSQTAPSQGTLAYTQPTRRACGSCHDDIVWANPYSANQQTMPAQANDSACASCHVATANNLDPLVAHSHPLNTASIDPGVNFVVTGVAGNAGSNFAAGESPQITFTVKNDAGANIPLHDLNSSSIIMNGPTWNRQLVVPFMGGKGQAPNPFDFSGRLHSSSTTNKASMSHVTNGTVAETLKVQFSSSTAYTVTGTTSGLFTTTGTLPAPTSTNPTGSALNAVFLTPSAVAQNITVQFSSSTVFAVTGSSSGAMGSGTLPAALSTSTRFTSSDGTVSFTVSVGTTQFVGTETIYLQVYQGDAGLNAVKFAIVVGRSALAANDRFYYEFIPAASSYTVRPVSEFLYEYLGNAVAAGNPMAAAGNLPVYWGRQQLYEVTATSAYGSTLAANAAAFDRYVVINGPNPGFANGDPAVIETAGAVGVREYVTVGFVEAVGATFRLWTTTPLRYAHAAGATIEEPTLALRQETTNYTLNGTTGVVTVGAGITLGNPLVMTYRSHGRFGYRRHPGDSAQNVYFVPPNDSRDLGQDWGDWSGLSLLDGTYTVALWGGKTIYHTAYTELQTYTSATSPAIKDFLYGATVSEIEPHKFISSYTNCNACHDDLIFHGGGRRGFETCIMCHSVAGIEDNQRYNVPAAAATIGATADFRTMLHKIHKGADLWYATTYGIAGNSGTAGTFEHIEFPAMPGGVKHCDKCHGAGSTFYYEPSDRTHPNQTTPLRRWRAACLSCHDSPDAGAHAELMTSSGVEACGSCHGSGHLYNVPLMHKNR